MTPLVLASTSAYRKELLQKLGLGFEAKKPLFDEDSAKTQIQDPEELCRFLGQEKARSLSTETNCVIGGDQLLVLEGEIFGKAGNLEKSVAQLLKLQGKTHELLTSVSIYFQSRPIHLLNRTKMKMLTLSKSQIQNYMELDQAWDCAGSYKIEKHGIVLFEKIETSDFTAIQGLPLMELSQVLRKLGYQIPKSNEKELI